MDLKFKIRQLSILFSMAKMVIGHFCFFSIMVIKMVNLICITVMITTKES